MYSIFSDGKELWNVCCHYFHIYLNKPRTGVWYAYAWCVSGLRLVLQLFTMQSIWCKCMARRVADGKMSMDEAYRKHHQLLKRQHFGREPPKVRQMF